MLEGLSTIPPPVEIIVSVKLVKLARN